MALASNLVQIGINSKEADFLGDTQSSAITATGTTQGTAFAITSTLNVVSTAVGGVSDSVRLPVIASSVKAFPFVVYNVSGATINIFPGSGDNFYGNLADVGTTMVNGAFYIFWPISSLTWIIKG